MSAVNLHLHQVVKVRMGNQWYQARIDSIDRAKEMAYQVTVLHGLTDGFIWLGRRRDIRVLTPKERRERQKAWTKFLSTLTEADIKRIIK